MWRVSPINKKFVWVHSSPNDKFVWMHSSPNDKFVWVHSSPNDTLCECTFAKCLSVNAKVSSSSLSMRQMRIIYYGRIYSSRGIYGWQQMVAVDWSLDSPSVSWHWAAVD